MNSRRILIAVIAIFAVSACLSVWILRRSDRRIVEIVQNGTVIETIDLNAGDRDIRIDSPDGGCNLIAVRSGAVCMAEADCPDQTCVRMGELKSDALPIVCLPHKLIVRFAEETP